MKILQLIFGRVYDMFACNRKYDEKYNWFKSLGYSEEKSREKAEWSCR